MTGQEGGELVTDEQFKAAVVSDNVIDADREMWLLFERFLGDDPIDAWTLIEATHVPQTDPQTGELTGKLVTTAAWKRDPHAPTPDRVAPQQEETPA